MAFISPNSPGIPQYYLPPTGQPAASPPPQAAPAQSDQVTISAPAPNQPQENVLPNGLRLKAFQSSGQTTGLYATLPGGPGGLLAAPILVSISTLPAQNALGAQFQNATAYEMGTDGKVARDGQGKPKELPTTVMSDGRAYVQTQADNPSAPLIMLDPNGSYGLATPAELKTQGDVHGANGYRREQSEFVNADNTRGFRVKEEVGAWSEAKSSGLSSLISMATGQSANGREVTYTQVQQTPDGSLASKDLRFNQEPGENWPDTSQNSWKSMLSMTAPDSRERNVTQEGSALKLEGGWTGKRALKLLTGQAGMGANSWTYGKQETIRFVPLSQQGQAAQQAAPAPQAPAAPPATPPPLPSDF